MPAPKDIDFYENPFGYEVRRFREQEGLTQGQLSERLGYTKEHISKVETGAEAPGEDFVRDCDTYFKTNGAMKALALMGRHIAGLPRWAREWFETEREAHTIRNWELAVVPGLLQTPDYARAALTAGQPGATEEQIERQLAFRLERQKILGRDSPPALWFIIDERVLHHEAGDPKVMYGQLQALIEASHRPSVTILVVPISARMHAGHLGAFAVASLDGEPDVVYLESARAGRVSERPEDVRAITNLWEAIRGDALPPRVSLNLIEKVAEQWT